ncbi:NAD(P)H-dependent FMN reductase [Jatrophihabitans sp. GAS493]|uniref:NADPH-dependent FMN reductase n=1 Tax=Jatrophihabitans sp. GAS493 TaxID=1907575 RepID=UPI000BBF5910|nr:NAD(P)H-dependent oxidoreductase [Jatrophihabitans sp. GAS493]SOD74829.1 NAD(P)H-dependent FMN reductase [Jatrophihabitans sp. GAS493]
MRACVVVGNPKLGSRTAAAGTTVAAAVLESLESLDVDVDVGLGVSVIELAELGSSLFSWGDPGIAAAKSTVLGSDLIVFASPVYKASYTGLLKAFLDQFGRDELAARAVVPLMVGASPAHSLAVETQLRPVLVEIGASCPTRGLYLLESQIEDLAPIIDDWLALWGGALRAVVSAAS